MARKLKVGLVGLGARGIGLLKGTLIPMTKDVFEIVGVCDPYQDRREDAARLIAERCGSRPATYADAKALLAADIEAVIIMSAWESHIDIAVNAMRAGKYVGLEVGGAYSVNDCWRLVRAYEETGTPCMLLENCCYGKRELMALRMAREGVLGEIVHCAGGYQHDLRQEIAGGEENRHYRLRNYLGRNCENYPTHELGPIAKLLKINDGNRMLTLTSTASAAKGMQAYMAEKTGETDWHFAQGDVVTTVIRCANGQTITLTLDTTLPRYYSRGFTVRGTKGSYFGETDTVFLDKEHHRYEFKGEELWGNAAQYEEQYLHPLWQTYSAEGGHDGMDNLVFAAFAEAALRGTNPPIDVYDAAAWMSITALSEESIALSSHPVAIPDFTSGRWLSRTDIPSGKYSLR